MSKFMIGQSVILKGQGGVEEIGTVVKSETGITSFGVWVFSPTKGYASDYSFSSVKPLPNVSFMDSCNETNVDYHIGVCSSCLITECVSPSVKRNHPERGCMHWTRNDFF